MTSVRIVEWTRDDCGTVRREETSRIGAPAGWTGLAANVESADASWDHPAWHRFHLCPTCSPEPRSTLGEMLARRGATLPGGATALAEMGLRAGVRLRNRHTGATLTLRAPKPSGDGWWVNDEGGGLCGGLAGYVILDDYEVVSEASPSDGGGS